MPKCHSTLARRRAPTLPPSHPVPGTGAIYRGLQMLIAALRSRSTLKQQTQRPKPRLLPGFLRCLHRRQSRMGQGFWNAASSRAPPATNCGGRETGNACGSGFPQQWLALGTQAIPTCCRTSPRRRQAPSAKRLPRSGNRGELGQARFESSSHERSQTRPDRGRKARAIRYEVEWNALQPVSADNAFQGRAGASIEPHGHASSLVCQPPGLHGEFH